MDRLLISIMATGLICATVLFAGKTSSAEELVAYKVVEEASIPEPLTDQPGDAARGRAVSIDRKKGNCLACHILPIPEESFHGETGPDLHGVANRYPIGELRLRVVNPKVVNPETLMPAFYRNDGLHRVSKKFQGKTILSAQDVEDVLAYLMSLKDQ